METSRAASLISRARIDVGLSQAELAQRAGTSQSAVAAIENDKRGVSALLLARLLRAADTRPSIPLAVHADLIRDAAASFGLSNIRVFGSVARGEDTSDSDVDLLAHFDETMPYFTMRGFVSRASEIVGFPVDLVLDGQPSSAMREIERTAVPL